ncbi:iron ABC transporter permease [Heyndrickxia oleronia]|uniref:Iron ABC transporter permease n=1 Tax=Heyndrickxia oleronia TaxID=38875 RepID=A0A8E2LH45_9BACI|nr:iron ABC transporter permease [Heyndrickxia oleronia]NYV67959.1 iron ABC transporter permease [Bacillus sp. Gen3]OJH18224.1 iron ABC transporter permease [Bacillus obstructivus]MCM3455901.1 iron ABC transporter permease [Heyndrickxia oleronia]MEC1376370.1 iron ABC transporter permease [Heyndrickxia oleronia]OOP69769.1 iron ABC transporter permease [Heyndrickxia oleronia]
MSQYKNLRLFKGKISFLVDLRAAWVIFLLFIVTLIALIVSTGLGDMNINPLTVVKTFFGGGTSLEQLVVLKFRLPRIIVSLFVGIALAMAGGILQGIIRNPLASPDIIGITGGAGAAVVSFLAIFSNKDNSLTVSIGWLPVAAFLGAAIVAFLVYFLAWKDGVSPIRLVLIGIGISAVMKAITTLLMILGPIYRASDANIWLTGTVNGSSWGNVSVIVPWVIILTIVALISARKINIQEFGDELATGVGSHVQRQRFFLLLLSTALVGAAVAFGGGIGFVGLMAPHMARRLVGSSFGALLPASAFLGGILVMVADLIGRTVFTPLEVPAGVFTAAIGAPYFIYLLFRTKSS